MQSHIEKIDIPSIRKTKDVAKQALKEEFKIPKSVPLLGMVAIKNDELRAFICDGLSAIGIAHIVLDTTPVKGGGTENVLQNEEDNEEDNVAISACQKQEGTNAPNKQEGTNASNTTSENDNGNKELYLGNLSQRRYSGVRTRFTENEVYAFDFFICDEEQEGVDIVRLMRSGVVPVTSDRTVFAGVFKDFNPMKFEGNGFFFKSLNPFCVFEKIVSYTENIKFPEDRRILIKNVIETF